MNRRNFVRNGLLAGAAASTTATLFGNKNKYEKQKDTPFNLNYAFHDGMFKNHGGNDFIDQIKFAFDKGFRSIEDNGMMGRSVDQQKKIGDTHPLITFFGVIIGLPLFGFGVDFCAKIKQ